MLPAKNVSPYRVPRRAVVEANRFRRSKEHLRHHALRDNEASDIAERRAKSEAKADLAHELTAIVSMERRADKSWL